MGLRLGCDAAPQGFDRNDGADREERDRNQPRHIAGAHLVGCAHVVVAGLPKGAKCEQHHQPAEREVAAVHALHQRGLHAGRGTAMARTSLPEIYGTLTPNSFAVSATRFISPWT